MNEKEEREPLVTRLSLLSKVKHGDEDAWSEFYAIYRGFIYWLARRGGLLHEDAKDLTQDTMAKIAQHIEDFKPNKDRARFRT
jgi:DNA-directed RNA polymerase specialized sigma24 family protein